MASDDASPADPGFEKPTSTTASAHDLPLEIRSDICHSLSHLPSLLNLAQASQAFMEPASSHVRTLQALDDLPGRGWDRFTSANGLKLLLNLSQQQQVSQLWQQTLERMPARVRRCVIEKQQAEEQQQAAQQITSIGSIIAAGLAASACASHLQQLTIDAPVSTSEASQLMALLAALQRLELNQLCRTDRWEQQEEEEKEQQQQPWRPPHVPKGLLHLQLKGSADHFILLDAEPFAAARALQSLQLLDCVEVHTIMAFTEVPQLSSLTISLPPEPQVQMQIGALSQLQALRHVILPWHWWPWPPVLRQVERMQVSEITMHAWPEEAVTSIKHLVLRRIFMELDQPLDGCLTHALPALEVLEVTEVVGCDEGLNALCRALSGHTALRSLSLPCEEWWPAYGDEQPWPQQGLASISSLTQLQVLNVAAADVSALLSDIAACTALLDLHLGLEGGAWAELGLQCRQRLRALQASSRIVRRCTVEGLGDD